MYGFMYIHQECLSVVHGQLLGIDLSIKSTNICLCSWMERTWWITFFDKTKKLVISKTVVPTSPKDEVPTHAKMKAQDRLFAFNTSSHSASFIYTKRLQPNEISRMLYNFVSWLHIVRNDLSKQLFSIY